MNAKETTKETKETKEPAGKQPVEQQAGGKQVGKEAKEGREEGIVRRRGPFGGLRLRRSLLGFPDLGLAMTNPFELMRRMWEDLESFSGFGRLGGLAEWTPTVDVFERGGRLVVRADLPGLTKDDVRVEVLEGGLLIEGERKEEQEEEEGGVYRSERRYGEFRRFIPLPEGVNLESCTASFKEGVLEVSIGLPEAEKRKGRRIEISEGEAPVTGKVKH